jgi:polyisoprenoid-binding protein YceI
MNENMYKVLAADKHEVIRYTLSGYDVLDGTATAFAAKTTGTLTIVGKNKLVGMKVDAAQLNEGKATAHGEQTILLTDFGITPPSYMFGTMKVGNEFKVKFNLKLGPEMIAQIAAATTNRR